MRMTTKKKKAENMQTIKFMEPGQSKKTVWIFRVLFFGVVALAFAACILTA